MVKNMSPLSFALHRKLPHRAAPFVFTLLAFLVLVFALACPQRTWGLMGPTTFGDLTCGYMFLSLLFLIGTELLMIRAPKQPQPQQGGRRRPPADSLATSTTAGGQHLFWMDNLRSFLTFLVVLYHVAGRFCGFSWGSVRATGVLQPLLSTFVLFSDAWLMPLFFFVTGFLMPPAWERRQQKLSGELGEQLVGEGDCSPKAKSDPLSTISRPQNHPAKAFPADPPAKAFLRDRFLRLFLPFCALFFVLVPLEHAILALGVIQPRQPPADSGDEPGGYTYVPAIGRGWFLAWLLLMNVCYVIVADPLDHAVEKAERTSGHNSKRPSLLVLWAWGLAIGGAQGLLVSVWPAGVIPKICYAPVGQFLMDIMGFWAGVLAFRNGWIADEETTARSPVPSPSRFERPRPTRGVRGPPGSGAESVKDSGSLSNDGADTLPRRRIQERQTQHAHPVTGGVEQNSKVLFNSFSGFECLLSASASVLIGIVSLNYHGVFLPLFLKHSSLGVAAVSNMVASLYIFKRFCNSPHTAWSKYLSEAAYAVYIVHDLFTILAWWLWVAVVDRVLVGRETSEAGGSSSFFAWPRQSMADGHFRGTEAEAAWLWYGFLFACLVSVGVSWPLGWRLKQVRGLRGVL